MLFRSSKTLGLETERRAFQRLGERGENRAEHDAIGSRVVRGERAVERMAGCADDGRVAQLAPRRRDVGAFGQMEVPAEFFGGVDTGIDEYAHGHLLGELSEIRRKFLEVRSGEALIAYLDRAQSGGDQFGHHFNKFAALRGAPIGDAEEAKPQFQARVTCRRRKRN